jgi:threonine/homoserine/homoserine lactone efflux protein
MLPTRHLLEFVLTIYVLIVIPGPSVLFVISRGVALGRRAALASVLGNTGGLILQLVLVAIGIGSIVASSDAVFTVVKLLGAAYLIYLGARNIIRRKSLASLFAPATGAVQRKPLGRTIREGFFVGATNPKGVLMFTAILPQFIVRSQGHVTLQLALLGAICVLIGLLSDATWAIASGSARQWFGRSPRRLERMTGAGGAMLIALGFGLALTSRRS